jgi:hypothetical protein
MEAMMGRLFDKNFLERVYEASVLGMLWTGLAICTLGVVAYDVASKLQ